MPLFAPPAGPAFVPSTGVYVRESFAPPDPQLLSRPHLAGSSQLYTWWELEPYAPVKTTQSYTHNSAGSPGVNLADLATVTTLIGLFPGGFRAFLVTPANASYEVTVNSVSGGGVHITAFDSAYDGVVIPAGSTLHYYAFTSTTTFDADIAAVQAIGKKFKLAICEGSCRPQDGAHLGYSGAQTQQAPFTPSWLASTAGDDITVAKAVTMMWAKSSGAGNPANGSDARTFDVPIPWSPVLLANYLVLIASVSVHLHNTGGYEAIIEIKWPLFGNDTAETRVPAQNTYTTDTVDNVTFTSVTAGGDIALPVLTPGTLIGNINCTSITNLSADGTVAGGVLLTVPTDAGTLTFSYSTTIAGPKIHGATIVSCTPGSTKIPNGSPILFVIPDANLLWQAAGYTRTLMEGALKTVASAYAAAFPDKQLWNAMIDVAAVPSIDALGRIVDSVGRFVGDPGYLANNLHADTITVMDFIRWGCTQYGRRMMFSRNSLDDTYTPPSTQPTLQLCAASGGLVSCQLNEGLFGAGGTGTEAQLFTAIANGLALEMVDLEIFPATADLFPNAIELAAISLAKPQPLLPLFVSLVDAATVTPILTSDGGALATVSQPTLIANPVIATLIDGQRYTIRLKSAAAQGLTYGAKFRAGTTALPAATSGGGKTDYLEFRYNEPDGKLDLVGVALGLI